MLRTLRKHTQIIMIIVILFFVASCFAGYGLYVRGGSGNGDGMRDYPVAEIDGRTVMRSELERAAAFISRQYYNSAPDDVAQIRRDAIDTIAFEAELEKEITARKIEATSTEVDDAYKRVMDTYPTREEFFAYMRHTGATEKELKEELGRELRIRKLFEQLGEERIIIEEEEVSAFYNEFKALYYTQPAGMRANIARFSSSEAAEAARAAIAAGAKWDEEIEKHRSEVEMATPYDEPILLTVPVLDNELAAIRDLPVNELSQVETTSEPSIYIAINRGREVERVQPLDEVIDNVRTQIRNQKMPTEQQKIFEEMVARADVKILDPSIFPAEQPETTEPANVDPAAPAPTDQSETTSTEAE